MITIRLHNLARLSPQALGALVAIARCYGAEMRESLRGAVLLVLPDTLVQGFLMTVERDVLPVEITNHI